MNADCMFCKIVQGKIPSTKVHEDADVLAFMDISPIVKGHTLVIPKAHHDPLIETPAAVLQQLILAVQKVARAQILGLGAEGVNVLQSNGRVAGQVVPHIHFHVIPRFAGDGHHWNWKAKRYDSIEQLQECARKIGAAMES